MTQEALKLALEALEAPSPMGQYKAITAIKEALREHAMREVQRLGQEIEQEPVAVVDSTISGHIDWLCTVFPKHIHTCTPPQD